MTVYIADTSAVMRHPEIVALFSESRELLIIPDVILRELDAEETSSNKTSSLSAKKALREICKSQNTTFLNKPPEYNPDPLPHDFFSKSNDNRIISIALRRRADHPILISNNPKLCSIAASLNLETISSHEFLESRRSAAAINTSPADGISLQLAAISRRLKIIYEIVEATANSTGFLKGQVTKREFIEILREKRNKQNENLLYIAKHMDSPFCIAGKYVNAQYMPADRQTAFRIRTVRPLVGEKEYLKGYSLCPWLTVKAPGHFNTKNLKIVSRQQQIQICFLVRACVDIVDGQEIGAVRLEAGAGRHAILFSASRMGEWLRKISAKYPLLDFTGLSYGIFSSAADSK